MIHQQADKHLQTLALNKKDYSLTQFHGGGKTRSLITKNDKIVVPETLQQQCLHWYHMSLCHPGATRMELTIRQHFTWKGLKTDVEKICKKCKTCQLTKRRSCSQPSSLFVKHCGYGMHISADARSWAGVSQSLSMV